MQKGWLLTAAVCGLALCGAMALAAVKNSADPELLYDWSRALRQEHKDAEGNMEVKGKIKQKMREMARKRMLAAVPQADLVVMNPTHYAVAIAYDETKMGAPRVVAKGMDLLKAAADFGYPMSQYNLGLMYANAEKFGLTPVGAAVTATDLYRAAAFGGHVRASSEAAPRRTEVWR